MESGGTLHYEIVDVFAPRPFEGDPLAVVLDADGPTTGQCQAPANELPAPSRGSSRAREG